MFFSFSFLNHPPRIEFSFHISKAFSDFPLDIILIISSPFLLRIITKDEEIAVKSVDAATAAAAAAETEEETEPEPVDKARADKSQAIRRSDISLMIEVWFEYILL